MAISTYKSFLMYKAAGQSTYSKLIDIKDFPDLGGTPEMLDATTQSDAARVYLLGIQETEALTFTANYMLGDFQKVKALEGSEQEFAVWFGGTVNNGIATPTGSDGKFIFKGYITVTKTGGGVNEVQNMTITIAPTTVIALDSGVGVSLNKHRLTLVDGDSAELTATKNPAGATVTWSSNNTSVASVSDGTVTAVDPGVAVIVATATYDGVSEVDTCTVTVVASE